MNTKSTRQGSRWNAMLLSVKRLLKRGYWRAEEAVSSKTPIYVIGDSHAGYFRFGESRNVLVRVLQLPGATAYGLTNEDSASGARKAVNDLLNTIDRRAAVVFQFGEVDCAFSVWKRAEENGTTPRHEVVNACRRYLEFILDVKALGFDRILVATVPPPTVADWKGWKGSSIARFREQAKASLAERTECTKLLNQRLRSWEKTGLYRFIDVERSYLDGVTGLVREELIVEDDLHLAWGKAREINLHELVRMGLL